jgi:hypothetical protein
MSNRCFIHLFDTAWRRKNSFSFWQVDPDPDPDAADAPTSGTAFVNTFDVLRQADLVRRSIGVIPQAMTSDLELSVEENLMFYAKLYSVPREKRVRLMRDLLEQEHPRGQLLFDALRLGERAPHPPRRRGRVGA